MTKVAVGAFSGGNDASQWLLFVGASTTTPLAQVKTFNWTQDVVTDEQMRVSSSPTEYTDKGHQGVRRAELWLFDVAEHRQWAACPWRLTTRRSRSSRCITAGRPAERW